MAVSLTHTTVAVGTNAGNGEIAKEQWNENHTLTMAADRILGRTTAGAGAVEEIAAGTGLTLLAGTLSVAANTYQPLDSELTALSGLASAADTAPYFTGAGTAALMTVTAAGRNLLDDVDAAAQRTTLGLAIGADVQAYDAELAAIAGLVSAADRAPYFTGAGTAALMTVTAAGRNLLDDADAAAQRTTLGLAIGTDVQAYDAELNAIAGLVSAADRLPYFTGAGTASLATFTTAGRNLLDDADAAAQRTTLGLGTADSPQFTAIELGAATDTTISRVSAGVVAVEGKNVALNGTTETLTTGTIELGHATDTTITRVSAGVAAIEGKNIALNGTGETLTTGSIELGAASDTTITRSAAGVLAVEGGVIPKENRANTFTANQIIEVTDNTNAALRITQLGTGEAFRVEDSTNPDSTPFVIDATGKVGIGRTPTENLEVQNTVLVTDGTNGILVGGSAGAIELYRSDSVPFIDFKTTAAEDFDCRIQQSSNGLNFFTGGNGSTAVRATIDSSGNVGIGVAPSQPLHVYRNNTVTSAQVQIEQDGTGHATLGFLSTGNYAWLAGIDTVDNAFKIAASGTGLTTNTRFLIDTSGNVLVTGPGGLGYGTGSGGTVTQGTNRTTGVTLNKTNGAITMFSAAGSTTAATFTVTNSTVAATDTIIVNQKSGTNLYDLMVTAVAAGSFNITFRTTGGTATDAPVINFAVIKAVTS